MIGSRASSARGRLRLTARGRGLLGLLAALGVGVAVGALAVPRAVPVDDGGVLDEAAARIAADAVAPVDRERLERAALDAMIAELGDPWSSWLPADASGGDVPGVARDGVDADPAQDGRPLDAAVGVRLTAVAGEDGESLVVAGVVPGSSAAEAGLRAGDVLEEVDDEAVRGLPTALARLRGPDGSRTVLGLRRADGAYQRVALQREVRPAVEVLQDEDAPDVVRVRVSAFPPGSGRAVRDAVEQASRDRAAGVVLDLRGNGGGLLHEAVETASALLDAGPVLTYQRRGEAPRTLEVAAPGDTALPLVVLVDDGTASAAEVVAAALADRRDAVLVGGRTVGKGSVQEPVVLPDGTSLRLTVARYLPPSGQVVEGVGLEPDVAVAPDAAPGVAEARAAEVLRGLVADADGTGTGAGARRPPTGEG